MNVLVISLVFVNVLASGGPLKYRDTDSPGIRGAASISKHSTTDYLKEKPIDANAGRTHVRINKQLPRPNKKSSRKTQNSSSFSEKPGSHSTNSYPRVFPKENLPLSEKMRPIGTPDTRENREHVRKKPKTLYNSHKIPYRAAILNELNSKEVVPGRVIVILEDGEDRFDPKWDTTIKSLGGKIVRRSVSNSANFLVVELENTDKASTLEFIENITQVSGVRYAEPELIYHINFNPNDQYWSYQWGPEHIDAPEAWDIQLGNMDVSIAILDQGVQYTHPDLADRFTSTIGYDFVNNDNDPMPTADDEDHGTHVAGIAAATINNNLGIAGIAGRCRLISLRICDPSGSCYLSNEVDALHWAADNGADVINMSLGGDTYSASLENACNYAWNQGCLLVAASGNEYADSISYPARFASVIAVGALDQDGTRASYSNYGPQLELTAPGTNIFSSAYPNMYMYMSGTSMATPHVSGVAALVWSQYPSLSNEEVRTLLQNTAEDRGPSGWDQYYGFGCVNAYNAVTGGGGVPHELTSGEPVYITETTNFIYHQGHIYWAVVGVRPDSGSDWDISLYEDTTFTQFLEDSRYGSSNVDFIVRDYNHAPLGWEGVSVYPYAGSGGATVEYEDGTETIHIGQNPDTWQAGDVVKIYDIRLDPGTYTFSLNISGDVDLGIGFYDSYNGPSSYALDRASLTAHSDRSGPGGYESFTVTLDHSDWYGVILWANNSEGGDYTIEVSSGGPSPELVYSDHSIDDDNYGGSSGNGNGIPEAGEIIEMPVQLTNVGGATATGVNAILRTDDPDITITDSVEYWPDIPPDSSMWCQYDYNFVIDSSASTHDVMFILDIHSAEGNWIDTFYVTVHASQPSLIELTSGTPVYITLDQDFIYHQSHIYWAAVGVRPDSGSDWDISLYEDTTFTQFLEDSRYGGSNVDFIVRDYNHAPLGWEGVGVYYYAGSGGATVEYEDGIETFSIGSNPGSWSAGDVFQMFDIHLDPGTYTFNLTISGNVDLGIGFYDSYNDTSIYVFDRASLSHFSDNAGPGGSESFAVSVDHSDWFGVILWANNAEGGDYSVDIQNAGIEEDASSPDVPRSFAMNIVSTGSRPVLKLALPHKARITLKMYDASGRLVQTIAEGTHYEAGYHTIVLSVEKLHSGIYFIRYDDDSGFAQSIKFLNIK